MSVKRFHGEVEEQRTLTIQVSSAEDVDYDIINGDFETGDLFGWTLLDGSDAAQNHVGVVSADERYWTTAFSNRYFYKQGNYFLKGESMEAFLIGAASTENKGSVKLYKTEILQAYKENIIADTAAIVAEISDTVKKYSGITIDIPKMIASATTDVDTYRFAIRFVVVDDTDADSVGIWSLYVIKRSDDTEPGMAYWGDGKNTPGINIGIIGPN